MTVTCGSCRHFCNEPHAVERAFPGMSTFSSAWAAVRSQDGLCAHHQRYLPSHARCEQAEPVPS